MWNKAVILWPSYWWLLNMSRQPIGDGPPGDMITSTWVTRRLAGPPGADATLMRLPGTQRKWSYSAWWLLEERRYLPVATKASGAGSAPQREAAAVLGEGRGRLVQARGGRPGGQPPERSTGDIFFFFTFCMKLCKKPVKRWPINALDGYYSTRWPLTKPLDGYWPLHY